MIPIIHAFVCEPTQSSNVTMNKKCLFLFCLVFCESHGCRDDYLKCFNDFVHSFFVENNATTLEQVNVSVPLPGDFKQVKNTEISGIEKTLREITGFLQDELSKNLNAQSDAVIANDNQKTRIYVKTFSYSGGDDIFSGLEPKIEETDDAKLSQLPFEFINVESAEEDQTTIKDRSSITDKNKSLTITDNETNKDRSTTSSPVDISDEQVTEGQELGKKELERKDLDLEDHNYDQYVKGLTPKGFKEKELGIKGFNVKKLQSVNETDLDVKDLNKNEVKKINDLEMKHIRENLIQTDDEYDYSEDNDNATDYPTIDYIELYKDTTNEENEYIPTEAPKEVQIEEKVEEYRLEIETVLDNDTHTNICHGNSSDVTAIFPWIATIFIKNETANQYQYICDGAIINERLLITAARCVNFYNTTVKPDDVLVFLGKRSLQTVGDNEMNVRIARIIIHEGFLIDGEVANDLALLVMEERVVFTDGIRPACLDVEGTGKSVKTSTTAWDPKGDLTPVFFEDRSDCSEIGYSSFCATYGNEVALCPSYGGIFAAKRASRWYLHAVRSGDVADRGLCFTKNVWYTPLAQYMDWIRDFME